MSSIRIASDYALDFAKCQSLELVQTKLRRAMLILEAHGQIVSVIQQHYQKVRILAGGKDEWNDSINVTVEMELQQCTELIENNIQDAKAVMEAAERTRLLVCNILPQIKPWNRSLLTASSFSRSLTTVLTPSFTTTVYR